jgi:phosphoribosylamine--glycine ligase
MKILVIGGGGREHALVWKLAQSDKVEKIYCAPGNAGTAMEAKCENLAISAEDIDALVAWAKVYRPHLTVIGPEVPLIEGIVDRWPEGLRIFGPEKLSAQIEGCKVFAKKMMTGLGIPTAAWKSFSDVEAAVDFLENKTDRPWVVKAPGACAGKGVIVCSNRKEAIAAVDLVAAKYLKEGEQIIIEERLVGREFSLLAICDGKRHAVLKTAKDHKPIGDGDTGENTGGMGCYSPADLTDEQIAEIAERGIAPIVKALEYKGVLYLGGMLCEDGSWYVLEYNCRFGDPETQVILPLLDEDLAEILASACEGKLPDELRWKSHACVSVVLASGGYPGNYEKGLEITGLDEAAKVAPDLVIFHAGTAEKDGKIVTSGGRVLCVTAQGGNRYAAKILAYIAVKKIKFEGMYYRSDIAEMAA